MRGQALQEKLPHQIRARVPANFDEAAPHLPSKRCTLDRAMPITFLRLGSPRTPSEGLRLGTVRRPPRGVPKADFAGRDFYDVWLPALGKR